MCLAGMCDDACDCDACQNDRGDCVPGVMWSTRLVMHGDAGQKYLIRRYFAASDYP